jgi:hypothetical protein
MNDQNNTYSWRTLQISESSDCFESAAQSDNSMARWAVMARLVDLAKTDPRLDAAMKAIAAEAAQAEESDDTVDADAISYGKAA